MVNIFQRANGCVDKLSALIPDTKLPISCKPYATSFPAFAQANVYTLGRLWNILLRFTLIPANWMSVIVYDWKNEQKVSFDNFKKSALAFLIKTGKIKDYFITAEIWSFQIGS